MDILVTHIGRIILLIIIMLSAHGAGRGILKVTSLEQENIVKKSIYLFSITLGLGVLSYLTLILGLMGLLYPVMLWGMLILFGFIGIYICYLNNSFDHFPRFKFIINYINQLDWFSKLLLIVFFIFALLNFIGALAPPMNVDDIKYHFAIPKRYVNAGTIDYISDIYFSNFPFPIEMLWTIAIGINSAELAQLINWAIGIIVVGWIATLVYRTGLDMPLVILSIILFYSITIVGQQSRTGNVELAGVLFFLAGIILVYDYKISWSKKSLILSGILCGIFAVVKISNAAVIILISFWLVCSVWRRKKSFLFGLNSGILFASSALLLAGVWYVKTYSMTGNPVYPFFQSFLGGPTYRIELLGGDNSMLLDSYIGGFKQLFRVPFRFFPQLWYLIAEPQMLRGHVSPMFLGIFPLVILNYQRNNNYLKGILIVSLLFYIYWVAFYPLVRIGLPFFALMSIPTAVGIYRVMAWGKFQKLSLTILLGAFLSASMWNQLREVLPVMSVVFGTQTRMDYINEHGSKRFWFSNYSAFNYINRNLPSDSKILLWSNDGFYLDRDYLYVSG